MLMKATRVAAANDAATVTRVLVDAFQHDLMWSAWAFPTASTRRLNRAVVFGAFVGGALRYPTTWIAPDDAAVAMWIPPGGTGLTTEEEVRLEASLRIRLGVKETGRILRALDLFAPMTPTEPHYYLSLLGTDPARAGHGWGRQLLRHSLSSIDAEAMPSYLDCADELVPLYQRFGFHVVGSLVLPDGPRSSGMWRPPAL